MTAGADTVLRYIQRLVVRPEPDEASDAALLSRFIARRDERAFTALVDRHGPLVLRVCHRVLGDVHDAEDAFQAAFLVLARKADAVRPREALAAWLHGVARRVALKARSARARQLRGARPPAAPPADPRPDPLAELSGRELLLVLDEEVQRLPDVYRLPVILCCLEGRSREEAAQQLGWTPGSVKARLERGRAQLHGRLVRRGLTLSAGLAAAEVARGAASAAVAAGLAARTARGAAAFGVGRAAAEGVSAGAAALAGQALRAMALARPKVAGALLLATGALAAGLLLGRAAPTPPPAGDRTALTAPAAPVNNPPGAPRDEADVPIDVSGRVLDPQGRPLVGARLYVGYAVRRFAQDFHLRPTAYPRRATSGADGRFHFRFAPSELDARSLDDSRPAVAAVADGYGPEWAEVGEPGRGAELTLRLVEDLPVQGRIVDQSHKPVAGAEIVVVDVRSEGPHPRTWRGPFPERLPGTKAGADGRFLLTGLGRARLVALAVDGPAIRHEFLGVATRPAAAGPPEGGAYGATFEYRAPPAQPIRGVVRDQVTGRPVAGVRVCAMQGHPPALTDEAGRFEIRGCPKAPAGYAVMAQPQTEQPYFGATIRLADRPGFDPLTVALDLVRGIPLGGRVTDQATGKPPRAAVVEYYPLFPNPHAAGLTHCHTLAASSAVVRPDGSYTLAVLPGPGVVCVAASPRNSYAVAVVEDRELAELFHDGADHGGGRRLLAAVGAKGHVPLSVDKYNALALIRPDEGAASVALDLTLSPARTLRGTVAGPNGEPLTGVEVVGLTALPGEEVLDTASFTVTGLSPRRGRVLFFRHGGKALGKVLTVRGDEAGPLAVRLDPCGSVVGRLVDAHGTPTPGAMLYFDCGENVLGVLAKTDRAGRFRVALLPGQSYSLTPYSARRLSRDVGAVAVESGRSRDLGDLPTAD
jgi:RNA polymerase sigma factor (sigma-70 family)